MNAVRLICFDAYIVGQGQPPYTLSEAIAIYDVIIDNAETLGMYVILNYHQVGTYNTTGQWSLANFWSQVAPRYKDRTHVIYEVANEPAMWNANAYTEQVLTDLADVYKNIVRPAAPNTPVLHLCYSSTGVEMNANVANYSVKAGNIDWSDGKNAVAFHGYNPSSDNISLLKSSYPVFNTEWDFPNNPDGNPNCSMDNELFMAQSMERLGISWLDWRSGSLPARDPQTLIPDALAKGYAWWTAGNPGSRTNLVANPSFEADNGFTQTPTGWNEWSQSGSDYDVGFVESSVGAGPPHSGSYYGVHTRTNAWQQVNTSQLIAGLTNGTYRLSAWVKSTAAIGFMFAGGFDASNNYQTTPIPVTNDWTLISRDVIVTNNQCEIGFYSSSVTPQWIAFDDVAFELATVSGGRIAAEKSVETTMYFLAYPNPATDKLTINFAPKRSERVSLHLYNTQGRLVKQVFDGTVQEGIKQQHSLDVSKLDNGLYIIRLTTPTGIFSRKLVLTH